MKEKNQTSIAYHPGSCITYNLQKGYREKKSLPGKKPDTNIFRDEVDARLIVRIKMDVYPTVLGHAGTREVFNGTPLVCPVQNSHDKTAVHMKLVDYTKRQLSGRFGPIARVFVLYFLTATDAASFVFTLGSHMQEHEKNRATKKGLVAITEGIVADESNIQDRDLVSEEVGSVIEEVGHVIEVRSKTEENGFVIEEEGSVDDETSVAVEPDHEASITTEDEDNEEQDFLEDYLYPETQDQYYSYKDD